MEVNWTAVGVMLTFVSLVVGASTIYLKLFVQNQLITMETRMMTIIKAEFQSKEVTEVRFNEVYSRIRSLEEHYKERLKNGNSN